MLAWLSVWDEVQICIWPSRCHCHSLSLAPVNPDLFYLPGFTFLVPAHPGSPGQTGIASCCYAVSAWTGVSDPVMACPIHESVYQAISCSMHHVAWLSA